MERAYEQGSGNGNPAIAKMYLRALGKVERGHGYKRHYRGTNSAEKLHNIRIVFECVKEHSDDDDGNDRWYGNA